MVLEIYNSLTRNRKEFIPPKKGRIGIYVCGPTVYDDPHIGHARSAYIFDVIVKYLRFNFKKSKVVFVRNVTDIDDKIIDRARRESGQGELKDKVKKISDKYLARYHEDMELLGLTEPDIEPKATETIKDMIAFIELLIKKGYAYESSGSVYFNIRKFAKYGELSKQSIDQMAEGTRARQGENKKDPLDFALWKASKEDEPSWRSPWGMGRPGWHIECSVMSTKYLKKDFVIHGGGLDLIFPHHENEIAQTVCAGKKCADYWIHNGLLTIDGQKMSKSLGNFITIKDFQTRHKDLDVLKLFFLSNHYRHPADYTEEKIEEMKKAKERILIFLQKIDGILQKRKGLVITEEHAKRNALFKEAMSQDFSTSFALGLIFNCVEDGNKILQKKTLEEIDYNNLYSLKVFIKDISKNIFGLNLEYEKIKNSKVLNKIRKREEARKNKDFNLADKIRQELAAEGVILEDTEKGTAWRRKV